MTKDSSPLSARNETGKPVDWWFMYKISSKSESTSDQVATGTEYLYYDDIAAKKKSRLSLSSKCINQKGALFQTLNQLFEPHVKSNSHMGWFFYNDENPDYRSNYKNPNNNTAFKPGRVIGTRGHTKGVLAFDLVSNSAFWLVHSTPKFPGPNTYEFPKTGFEMAQTFLCITLKDATTAMKIAQQMFAAQQPNVYAASPTPTDLIKSPNDDRVLLMHNKISSGRTPFVSKLPFKSRKGKSFHAIAKNKWWGHDFYNDLVGPTLHENLEVETWEHGKTPHETDSDKTHKVIAMKSVNLAPLKVPFSWSEAFDHAKLAISAPSEKVHWICVGDINFTIAQEKRGGGTVAFQCDPLWKSLREILSSSEEPKRKSK